MEETTKSICSMITAIETRNELLHEEIKRNEEAIKELRTEQILIEDKNKKDISGGPDKNLEMVG